MKYKPDPYWIAIYYNDPGIINCKKEDAIEKALKPLGLEWTGSGVYLKTMERDMGFRPKKWVTANKEEMVASVRKALKDIKIKVRVKGEQGF